MAHNEGQAVTASNKDETTYESAVEQMMECGEFFFYTIYI